MLKAARKIRRGKTVRAVAALILREMETTFGRSPGGYLWAVAEPVAAIALLSVAFSIALRAPALGSSFALFYATGYLPFTMALDTANKVANAIRFSRPLLTYPAVTFLDALLARFTLNLLTHALVFCLVIAGIAVLLGADITLNLPRILSAMAMASVLGLGVGTLNCLLFNIWPLWERIWQIVTRPLFIVSGVFFLPEEIPVPYDFWLALNPVVHVVGEMRRGLYAGYEAPGVSHVFVYGLGLGCLALGLVLLGRHHRAILGEG
ncbi:MAG: ABC transporter permease [Frigidibacter sp.]|nr:ABC transporter permease [Frigidibacter sp.]MDP3338887.1 ABC transporter permease [Frigidibacter sp.]